ncbi:tyrosine--tRNA ligase, partial [Patescibacteria group bacterium]|nr:tyrosine--tRNA ligase [Patescibacteria group bacterium]
ALALPSKAIPLSELLNKTRLASSRSEARRLISQGGVRVDGVRQTKDHMFSPRKGMVLQVGKRKFAKIA